MTTSDSNKTTFKQAGFLSDEVRDEKWKVEKHYEKDFSSCKRMNELLMLMADKIDTNNSRKELISNIINVRFSQSLQSTIILLEHAINSDSYSLIRNMQECYLALACLLQDEDYFIEINEYDEVKFKLDMIKMIENNDHLSEIYKNSKQKTDEFKTTLSKQISEMSIKQRPDAIRFYEKTKDDFMTQLIYFDYRFASNTHCHISVNSFMQNFEKSETSSYIKFRGMYEAEMRPAIKKIIDVCTFFALKLDASFFENQYNKRIISISSEIYEDYISKGVVVHKETLSTES